MLLVVALVGTAAPLFLLLGRDEAAPTGWDPRVVELVRFVERARGLDFDRAVPTRFLSEDDFRAEVTTAADDLGDEERRQLEAFEGVFRAIGLVEGEVDLFEEVNELQGGGVLAYYDTDEEEVVVRGTEMTVGVRATLVHELVHALQDQHFGLDRLDDEDATDGEDAAFRALVEGDAQRIEFEYVAELSDADLSAYQDEFEARRESAGLDEIPPVLVAFFSAPYVLGEGLVATLAGEGSNEAVDDAFGDPPVSEEHLLDPWSYLDGDEPAEVAEPEVPEGSEEVESGDFGAVAWYLLLAERMDPRRALQAVDGWGGDAYVVYEEGGRSCVRLAFAGDSPADVDEMSEALDRWTAGMPAGTVERREEDGVLHVASCDPGADVDLEVRGVSEEVLLLPLTRTVIRVELTSFGVSREDASCVSDTVIAELDEEQLLSLSELLYVEQPPPEIPALFERATSSCGLG